MIPQLIYLAIGLMGLSLNIARHGEKKKKKTYDGWEAFLALIILWALLYWGGFWDPMFK